MALALAGLCTGVHFAPEYHRLPDRESTVQKSVLWVGQAWQMPAILGAECSIEVRGLLLPTDGMPYN